MPPRHRLAAMNNHALIEVVRNHKALWDKATSEKTEPFLREKLWDAVAVRMGCSKGIVKARWKNLRDAYRKLIKKSLTSSRPPKWPYFKEMEFLKDISMNTPFRIHHKQSSDGKREIEDPENNSSSNSDNDPLSMTLLKVHGEEKEAPVEQESSRHFVEMESIPIALANQQYAEDEDMQFLLSLYPHFKQVSPSRKLPMRMKIEQIIYEELYGGANGQNPKIPE